MTYERYVFFTRHQMEGESYEQYMSVPKNLAKSFAFKGLTVELIKDIFICGINDTMVKEALLRLNHLNMKTVLRLL